MSLARSIKQYVRRIVDAFLSDVHTHIPAQVVSYNPATNTCVVLPCIQRMKPKDPTALIPTDWPPIADVPVKLYGSSTLMLTAPVTTGSYGWLEVSERAFDNWYNLAIGQPTSARKFNMSDAIFDPGLYPLVDVGKPAAINVDRIELRDTAGTTYVAVLNSGIVEIDGVTAIRIGGAAVTDYAVAYTDLKTAFDLLKSDFNTFVTVKYNLHTHPTAPVGPVSIPSLVGTSTAADMSAAQVTKVMLP